MTIFEPLSIDPEVVDWSDYLYVETPVELRNGRWYKREDKFAPLGPGAPNGVKVRQLIWELEDRKSRGVTHVLTGGSVISPQNARTAMVGRYFGLDTTIVLGGRSSTMETLSRHAPAALSVSFGANIDIIKAPYNPAIRSRLRELAEPLGEQAYVIPYGVSADDDESDERIAAFHEVSARQAMTLPAEIENIVMTFGSGNASASMVQGLAAANRTLKRLDFVNVGGDRKAWFDNRIRAISRGSGIDVEGWLRETDVHWHDTFGTGMWKYHDRVDAKPDGVRLHPIYEAKTFTYMDQNRWFSKDFMDRKGKTLFWIVGGLEKMPSESQLRRGWE